MRYKNNFKKLGLSLALISGISIASQAQVKVGTNPTNINLNAAFEVQSDNKGLLLPRLALQSTTSSLPLTQHVQGMVVYNTSSAADLTPGYYYNDGSKWLRIAAGPDAGKSLLSGSGAPSDSIGSNGDFYINTATNTLIGPKTLGHWPTSSTSLVGPAGANGRTVLSGTSNPIAATGADGDFYINTATNTIFGPKASGAWPATGTSLVGPQGPQGIQGLTGATGPQGPQGLTGATGPQGIQGLTGTNGRTLLSGTNNPVSATGADGDFYINTATNTIFGPKASGAWPATGISLIGPQGPQGIQGLTGATGPQGPQGLTGATGPQGIQGVAGTNGRTVLSGTSNPIAATGTDGDFYINTATNTIFGPKVTGAWPATGTSLVGPAGSNATVTGSAPISVSNGIVSLNDGGVTTLKLGDNAVNSNKIADGSIQAVDLADGVLTASKLADNSITSAKILDETISTNDLANGSITSAKLNQMGASTGQALTWNGVAWVPSNIVNSNLYSADGSLAGNRLINQGANTLSFISSATTGTSHFSVDSATLSINSINNRIGIGTRSPESSLDVRGQMILANDFAWGTGGIRFRNTTGTTDGGIVQGVTGALTYRSGASDGAGGHIWMNGGAVSALMTLSNSGLLTINGLAGTGSRMVVANASGALSTQAIPAAADGSETRINAGTDILITGIGTTASPYVIAANSSIVNINTSTTITAANSTILCNVPALGMTLTLPSASSNTGKKFIIRKVDRGDGVLTFSPALNYSTTETVTTLNYVKTLTVQSDGSAWWIISE